VRFASDAPAASQVAVVSGFVRRTTRSAPMRYPVYANAHRSARTMPTGSMSTPDPPITTIALPTIANASAPKSIAAGRRRSSAMAVSMTHTGYV
jgi:hypothetical protein